MRRHLPGLGGALAGGAALAVAALGATPATAGTTRTAPPGALGTVDTVAGPGFCPGRADPDRESARVGALATEPDGTLWFESGAPGAGLVAKVSDSTSVAVVGTALTSGRETSESGGTSSQGPVFGMALDGSGGVLAATSRVIVRVAEGPSVLAGGEAPGTAGNGDGGPLRDARFTNIVAIANDREGNVYVADEVDRRSHVVAVRFLNRSAAPATFYRGTQHETTVPPGTAATIAGGRAGRAAPEAGLVARHPDLTVTGERLYLSATVAGAGPRATVRVLNLSGTEAVVHARRVAPGAFATVATVRGARRGGRTAATPPVGGTAVDEAGNLYVAEPANHRVLRVDASGATSVFAGTGVGGFNGNDRGARTARLSEPLDVAAGAGGRIFVSDAGNDQVRVVDQAGTIRASLGNGVTRRWVCAPGGAGRVRPVAENGAPASLAPAAGGNVYVSHLRLAQVHQVSRRGVIRAFDGNGAAGLAQVVGVAPAPPGGVYVLELGRIHFLNTTSRLVAAAGGSVAPGTLRTLDGAVDAGAAVVAAAADPQGSLVVGDLTPGTTGSGRLRVIAGGGPGTVLVPPPGARPDGTLQVERCCSFPAGLAVDRAGNVYVADTTSGRVWYLNRTSGAVKVHGVEVAGGALEIVAGAGEGGSRDEGVPARQARLARPRGLALDRLGNLYVADVVQNSVYRVDRAGTMTTVAGTGQAGFNGDGLKGVLTALRDPMALAIDACGDLLIADSGNSRVRRLILEGACPALPAAPSGNAGASGGIPLAAAAGAAGAAGAAVGAFALARRRMGRRGGRGA